MNQVGGGAEVVLQFDVGLDGASVAGCAVAVFANQPVDLRIFAKFLNPGARTSNSPPSAMARRVR